MALQVESGQLDYNRKDDAGRWGLQNPNYVSSARPSPFGDLPYAVAVEEFLATPAVEVAVLALVLLSAIVVALETLPDLSQPSWQDVAQMLANAETGICGFFFVEFVLRWYSRSLRPGYVTKPLVLVDIISWLPLFLRFEGISTSGSLAPFIACLRTLRVFRLQRFLQNYETFLKLTEGLGIDRDVVTPVQLEVSRVLLSLFTLLYTATGAVFAAEHDVNPSFPDFFTALYFGLTTLTTVGFGDITPITVPGRFVVAIAILAGVAVIPVQLTRLAEALMVNSTKNTEADTKQGKKCRTCGVASHRSDAAFCWRCGKVLPIDEQ